MQDAILEKQLVGGDWNMTGLFFHSVGNVIIPIDELIFSRGVQSTNQVLIFFKIPPMFREIHFDHSASENGLTDPFIVTSLNQHGDFINPFFGQEILAGGTLNNLMYNPRTRNYGTTGLARFR